MDLQSCIVRCVAVSSIRISDLDAALQRELEAYTRNLTNKVNQDALKITKELVSDIKSVAPVKTGAYRKGWKYKKVGTSYIVHNSTNYQLTHLLEKGFAKVSGGRVPGKPHIQPAEQTAIRKFEEAIERAAQS